MATRKKTEKSEPSTIRIRQVRSGIGFPREMRETLRALGLRRMHQQVERIDSRETRGMIARIPHLVEVIE
ncbi:MAG TPA: 50S ribosomal protein L30 [Thermoanaerobaculia bacterium]|nr:50S ribosomal protein L30 [Thermoanaerobaculia bacterium]